MTYTIHQGDNRDILKTLPDNTIDAIVTDPPYGIDFLGKAWDVNTGELETYQECLRVLKPGGHILAFSAARTYHHLAMTLERAGFEIRDQIMWIYSSGFPKSQDIGKSIDRALGKKNNLKRHDSVKKDNNGLDLGSGVKCPKCNKDSAARYDCQEGTSCGMIYRAQTPEAEQWLGWGTALKPAHEPICLARKPLKLSIARNVQEWGVGALNIDATRVPFDGHKPKPATYKNGISYRQHTEELYAQEVEHSTLRIQEYDDAGRFPSNVIGEIAEPYQKYFYCPKVSRAERHIGLDLPPAMFGDMQGAYDNDGQRYAVELDKRIGNVGNNHPTVKPVELMKYLIRLITPPGGTVLDPYNGSGSTGMAAVELGFDYIGCELDPNYVAISHKRISSWRNNERFDSLFDWGDE